MKWIVCSCLFITPFLAEANKPKAPTQAEKATPKETKLTVVAADSKVEWFATKKVTGGHNGTISIKSGEILMGEKSVNSGKLVVDLNTIAVTDIPMDSKDNAKLVGHLKDADFFDVAKFPEATLELTSGKELSPGKHEVTGKLTIKGKTENVTFPIDVTKDAKGTKATGKLTLDRTKFDVKYGSANFFKLAADRVINDNFDLQFTVVAK